MNPENSYWCHLERSFWGNRISDTVMSSEAGSLKFIFTGHLNECY